MKVEYIAKCCHEINKEFCESIGDYSQVSWEQADYKIRESAINGVMFAIENPDVGPEEQHNAWMNHKFSSGWVYGPIKNTDTLEHPCLVPYDALPEHQKAKDKLFRKVVELLK